MVNALSLLKFDGDPGKHGAVLNRRFSKAMRTMMGYHDNGPFTKSEVDFLPWINAVCLTPQLNTMDAEHE